MLTKNDLSQIQKSIRNETAQVVQQELSPVKKDIKTIKSTVRKINKTVDVMASLFDREDVRLRKRVGKIEDHLGLSAQS